MIKEYRDKFFEIGAASQLNKDIKNNPNVSSSNYTNFIPHFHISYILLNSL